MTALYHPTEIFSRRHVPTWLLLSFAAGSVNASALMASQRYVTHVTGTVTRIGMEVVHLTILLDFAMVLGAFIAGASLSGWFINGRAHSDRPPLHWAPLVVVAAVTIVCAIAGHLGYLGRFGGAPDETGDFILLGFLSFASGLQNAAVATTTGLLVRTTHLTGPATDLGIHLVELAYTTGEQRRRMLQHALLRGGKIVAFAGGATVGVLLSRRLEYLALLAPAAIVIFSTLRSFLPARIATDGEESASVSGAPTTSS